MKVLDVLLAYQGIIGTLLGVITTLLISTWLKKFGKVYVSAQNYKISFCVKDFDGSHYYVSSYDPEKILDQYLHGNIELELALYNSSDEHKGLKNIKIYLLDNNGNEVFIDVPHDQKTSKFAAGAYHTDEVKVINLPSKVMVHYDLILYINVNYLSKLSSCERILFEAQDHRNRRIRKILIKTLDASH